MAEKTVTLPDAQEIRTDLEYMTARWGELPEPAMIEVRAFKDRTPKVAKFASDWIDDAVDWIVSLNELGHNIYVVRNPIRASVTGSASDKDILAAFFLWADCDDRQAAENVYRFGGPKWSAAVTTGKTPEIRVHTYWQLAEPCYDLAKWRSMQEAIAAHFRSDPSVINPSRIMRVGGTVSYPDEKKQAKGYVREVCTIRTEYDETREPVTMDQMRRVFTGNNSQPPVSSSGSFSIDTGSDRKTSAEYADILRRARTDGEKHTGVRDLCASLAGGGVAMDLARAIAQSACPIWDENAENLLSTAYQKYYKQPHRDEPNFDYAPSDDAPGWAVQSAGNFVSDFVSPEYIIEGVIQRGRLYTLTAPTGSGKTAAMLYAATAIATGGQFCGLETEPGDVLFLAGENPDDVRARVIATLEFYNINPATCRLHFIAGTFSIRRDMERLKEEAAKLPDLVMIVVDTFAAYFDGDDENSNAQALDFARVVRALTAMPSKPAAIMPAHPVKNATKGNLSPKGGSSLLNEVDGNLTLWNSDGLISMHWQGKHRGPDFEPLKMELERHTSDKLRDRKGREMPTILAKPVLELRAMQIARETLRIEDQLLLNISDDESLSMRERCTALGILRDDGTPYTGRISRLMDRLAKDKMIKKVRRRWVLTSAGEDEVNAIAAGLDQPLETEE